MICGGENSTNGCYLTVLSVDLYLSNTRQSALVIMVGVAYVNVCIVRHLKEELAWAMDKRLWLIINAILFKTVIPLRI